jgi:hypothetical protein
LAYVVEAVRHQQAAVSNIGSACRGWNDCPECDHEVVWSLVAET